MKPEGSLPGSEGPATAPYPQTNPVHIVRLYFSNTYFNIILTSGFNLKLRVNFSSLSCMLHVPRIVFFLIWLS
jgi:hypothetical protein